MADFTFYGKCSPVRELFHFQHLAANILVWMIAMETGEISARLTKSWRFLMSIAADESGM